MQRASLVGWGFFGIVGIAAVVGCAVGSNDDGTDGTSDLTDLPVEAGGDVSTIKLPPPASTADASADEDASPEGGPIGDAGVDSGPIVDLCKATNACQSSSTDLGSISGDEGGDVKTASGTSSQWFKITVNETDNSVIANDEKIRVALTSPTGTNFDIYLYRSGNTSSQECSAIATMSTSTGATDSVDMSWGESGAFSNGSDDSAEVTIEVRHVSGTCSATAKWALTVTGNP